MRSSLLPPCRASVARRVAWPAVAILSSLTIAAFAALDAGAAKAWAQPSDRAELERMANRASARIRALQQEAESLASRERTLLGELRRLEIDRQIKAEELIEIAAQTDATRRELAETSSRIVDLEQEVVRQRPGVETRLVELYKLGRPGYMRLLLGVDDLRSIARAYRMVAGLAELDRQRIEEHRLTLERLGTARDDLEARHLKMRALEDDARRARQALDRAVANQTKQIDEIDRRRDLTAQFTGELQLAQRQLQAALAALASGTTAPLAPQALPLRPFRGDLEPPVRGRVIAPFGRQEQTRFGTTIQRNGVELAAEEGAAVQAIHEGEVAFADTFTGFGHLVILDHGAQSYSLYGYLSSLTVERGARVDRHQALGTVGRAPGGPTALYFELRIDGQPVDPIQWLKKSGN